MMARARAICVFEGRKGFGKEVAFGAMAVLLKDM
jgi:hypothetical protein